MKIAICGSLSFEPKMQHINQELSTRGYDTVMPHGKEGANTDPEIRRELIDDYFAEIDTSDAVLVVNETKNGIAGYIGGNVLMEMSRAYGQGLEIFMTHPAPDMSYQVEIEAMQPIVLDGDLDKLDDYVVSLPLLYMSTESVIKHTAVSRAMRRAGMPVRVDGAKVESGVNEQPMTVEETREGAMNRHANLKKLGVQAEYYATIESGQHPIHPAHSLFGCAVVLLERAGESVRVGIDVDIEFPRAMLDKVPSQYPDLGVLVQQEYGAADKDPYPYLTHGKLTRQRALEAAVYNVAVQL